MGSIRMLVICWLSVFNVALATDIIGAANTFANQLYNVLPKRDKNLVFSPFSVHTALSLAYQGAASQTAVTFRQGLNIPEGYAAAKEYRSILTDLKEVKNVTLQLANKIYVKRDYELKPTFKQVSWHSFLAGVQNINFLESTAADDINAWIRRYTNNKIDKLVSQQDFDKYTRAIILNAIYFKGSWARKFNESETLSEKFYVSETEAINCHMMHQEDQYYYYEDNKLDAQLVKLRYKDKRFNLIVILPYRRTGVDDLERKLASTDISYLVDTYGGASDVILSLPRFKIETTLQLKEPLSEMGLGKIFEDTAEFPNMVDSKNLTINNVFQKTFIEVNEEGSEAAVGSGVAMALPVSLHYSIPAPVEFKADHPFIFYITIRLNDNDKNNNLVLFMGKVTAAEISN